MLHKITYLHHSSVWLLWPRFESSLLHRPSSSLSALSQRPLHLEGKTAINKTSDLFSSTHDRWCTSTVRIMICGTKLQAFQNMRLRNIPVPHASVQQASSFVQSLQECHVVSLGPWVCCCTELNENYKPEVSQWKRVKTYGWPPWSRRGLQTSLGFCKSLKTANLLFLSLGYYNEVRQFLF